MVQERYYEYAPMIEDELKPSRKDTIIEEMFDCIDVSCNDPDSCNEGQQITEEEETPKVQKFTSRYHSKDDIIGDQSSSVLTRSKAKNLTVDEEVCLLSQIEPLSVEDACNDSDWKNAMKEELDQIIKNDTWELVPRPSHKNVIGTKWIFRN